MLLDVRCLWTVRLLAPDKAYLHHHDELMVNLSHNAFNDASLIVNQVGGCYTSLIYSTCLTSGLIALFINTHYHKRLC